MKSTITLTVENEEDISNLIALCESFKPSTFHVPYRVTVLDYEVAVDIENAPAKTVLPEAIYDAIRECAIATENLSQNGGSIRTAIMLQDWLNTQADWAEPKHKGD